MKYQNLNDLPDGDDGDDKTPDDGTCLYCYARSFVPANDEVETDQLIESSYLNRLIR